MLAGAVLCCAGMHVGGGCMFLWRHVWVGVGPRDVATIGVLLSSDARSVCCNQPSMHSRPACKVRLTWQLLLRCAGGACRRQGQAPPPPPPPAAEEVWRQVLDGQGVRFAGRGGVSVGQCSDSLACFAWHGGSLTALPCCSAWRLYVAALLPNLSHPFVSLIPHLAHPPTHAPIHPLQISRVPCHPALPCRTSP